MSSTTRREVRGKASARVDARRLARERMLHRRRRAVLTALLVAALGLVGMDLAHGGTGDPPTVPTSAAARHPARTVDTVAPSPSPSVSPTPLAVSYPRHGARTFRTAAGASRVYGDAGSLARFQVAVENGISNLDVAEFADQVTTILADRQGWTAGGEWRFQRVGPGRPHEFTLYLVTPASRDAMCQDVPEGYTSCRYGNKVMINVSRWVHGVSYYPSLGRYRDYAISHEVGHWLGHGHELCPGKGRRAPTMQQQTLGLHGCVTNPWPYPDGEYYAGPQGEYPQTDIPTDPPSFYRH
ncbi:MAG: DUF3152 domain-containing protein [Actinocatenispora sp.]